MKLLLQVMGREVQQFDRPPPFWFLGLRAVAGGTKPGLGQVEKCPGTQTGQQGWPPSSPDGPYQTTLSQTVCVVWVLTPALFLGEGQL